MKWLIIPAAAGALTLAAAYAAVRVGGVVPPRCDEDVFSMPDTEQYNVFREQSKKMIRDTLSIPYEDVFITSFDGLRLHAKFYAASERKAPVQIMFHGYKSAAERDFCGGLREGIDGGFNVLLVDQRAHGESEGKYLTFGVNERFDCLSWASYAAERFGNDVKIYLYGISMGAATVLMASALPLPKSVSGIVADCGYTSPKDIIFSVLRDHHVPAAPVYAVACLGARLFCGFDLDSASAPEALSHSRIPVLFIHGDDDRFVPCRMSRENFEASAAERKKLLIVPNAGHGLSYMLDRPAYLSALHEFLEADF